MQRALADPAATNGVVLRARCGLHAGVVERRNDDLLAVWLTARRAALGAAHGGQYCYRKHSLTKCARDRAPPSQYATWGWCGYAISQRRARLPSHPSTVAAGLLLRSLEATPNNLPLKSVCVCWARPCFDQSPANVRGNATVDAGGSGGSRQVRVSHCACAADAMDDYPDGVWLVEFAALTDEGSVPQAVASVLGVREEGGSSGA